MPSRGEPFPHETGRAIAGCDRFVVFLTENALGYEWVRSEWMPANSLP